MATYVCSDFHGFKSLYDQIHNFIKPEDKVYFLGDAADRGPQGWSCIKAILNDPQWIYIKGNHDFSFIHSIIGPYASDYRYEHISNGGDPTIKEYLADGANRKKYIHRLNDCPVDATYVNKNGLKCYMSHSGSYRFPNEPFDEEDFVWDRMNYMMEVPKEVDCIIHGHTPIPHIFERLSNLKDLKPNLNIDIPDEFLPGTAFWYNGHCDVDNFTILTGATVLVDLDTFEEIGFQVSESEREYLWK